MQVVLASGSPRRLDLLRQIGIHPVVLVSHAEEVKNAAAPEEVVRENARRKGRNVIPLCGADTLVIAADTIVAIDGKILGKPKDAADAASMLRRLSGRTHQVYTGLYVAFHGQETLSVTATEVTFYPLDEDQIHRYIASGEPLDKAGAYGIQGRAACFIPSIKGSYSNVVGLPVAALYTALKELDVTINDTLYDQGHGTGGKTS
jgi:septum formation protein